MPNWRKVIVSGSDASLNSLQVLTSVTASIFSGSFTGSLQGTSSWANNATTASYVLQAVSASHAATASSADDFLVRQNITASSALITGTITAQTLVVSTVSSSVVYSSGSNIFGNSVSNVQQFTGSLRVTGDTLLKGSGNTSATTALTVQNSDAANAFRVLNNGQINLGNSALPPLIRTISNASPLAQAIGGTKLFFVSLDNETGSVPSFKFSGDTLNYTAGNITVSDFGRDFLPTSGTGTITTLRIAATINQTGGASGITRGLYVQPTLTSAADWRSIEWSNNTGWGLYGAGTANNYLRGNLSIGTLTTGSALTVSGSSVMSGSLSVTQGITGSLFGTSSWASNAVTSSYVLQAVSSSFAATASLTTNVVGTANRILYNNATNITTTSNNLTFDGSTLVITGSLITSGSSAKITAGTVGGDEGGELLLGKPQTNTTLTGSGVTIDVYQNRLRFFEQGGDARGYFIDITGGGAGVSTNLVGGGGTPGGSNTQIQYNNAGAFGGVSTLTFDGTTLRATGSFTGSLVGALTGTASYATQALTASYVAYASSFPYTGSALITGSLGVTGSISIGSALLDFNQNTNVVTGSYQVIASEATASYRTAFFDYVIFSGSISRAGTIYTVWSGSTTEWYENYTSDIGGSTNGVQLQTAISSGNIQLQATASTAAWTIRSLVRML